MVSSGFTKPVPEPASSDDDGTVKTPDNPRPFDPRW